MAVFFNDFSDKVLGAQPSGWTKRISLKSDWTVQTGGDAIGGRWLREVSPGGDNENVMLSLNAVDTDAGRSNCEVLFRAKSSTTTNSNMSALLRGAGALGSENCYRVSLNAGNEISAELRH